MIRLIVPTLASAFFLVVVYALSKSLDIPLKTAIWYMVVGVIGVFVINLTEGKR